MAAKLQLHDNWAQECAAIESMEHASKSSWVAFVIRLPQPPAETKDTPKSADKDT